ncbi:cyclase family protein [Clostridium cellulovorans]|uniref:Cyclase family protein n=1 Tax=Clostridium cellulovorans (strain ATCC 35296 / DSM 3052 / OCM 3 / 743B) TaxID=573061 RepID=D9SUT3_CLOC7|nr:cyclase family protein [Clostridium cellulovorans]ADL50988.1 cyclase family protein [Clostridium cellulovorans 743B]
MKKIIDLSCEIMDRMPVYPGDEEVRVFEDRTLDKDQYYNTRVEVGMHIGTHIDAPRHLIYNGKYINEYNLEAFIGNGCLLDVRGEEIITMKDEYNDVIKEADIVLLYTGFGDKYGSDIYYKDSPVIDIKMAEFLVQKKIKMVGMDMPSPDKYPFQIHKLLFENDVFVLENLTNLHELINVEKFEVIALPLSIKAEAAIVRAIARI